jgi:hypothetical protein
MNATLKGVVKECLASRSATPSALECLGHCNAALTCVADWLVNALWGLRCVSLSFLKGGGDGRVASYLFTLILVAASFFVLGARVGQAQVRKQAELAARFREHEIYCLRQSLGQDRSLRLGQRSPNLPDAGVHRGLFQWLFG